MNKYEYRKIIKSAANITQLGLNIIIPIFLCIFGSIYIKNKLMLNNNIVIIGIFLGLSAGFLNFFKIAKKSIDDASKDSKKYSYLNNLEEKHDKEGKDEL